MALINCPECNKEVSDKAPACPNCGVPIYTPDKEYIVCPVCKSKDVTTSKKGFSGKKAVAGAVLTGGIGLLAGTIGSNRVMLYCNKCGNRFTNKEAEVVVEGTDADKRKEEMVSSILKFVEDEGNKEEFIKEFAKNFKLSVPEAKETVEKLNQEYSLGVKMSEDERFYAWFNLIIFVLVFIIILIVVIHSISS